LIKRRLFMAGLAMASQSGALRALAGEGAPNLDLLVAGPDGEQTSRWGDACALALSPGFPGAPNIIAQAVGGLDGVTGANRLDALVVPDGKTAAILPGAALFAWMTGDDRVHFDPTRWAPVMGGTSSGVLVARLGTTRPSVAALRAFGTLRLAADSPQSADLAALLGLQCLDVPTAPTFGLRGADAKTKAFVAGEADAVFLCGEGVPADIAPLSANGGVPVFCIGQIDASGAAVADPVLPWVPDLLTFRGGASVTASAASLDAAFAAAAAAARLDFFVVLPRLTDPSAVAAWRLAALTAVQCPALQAAASASAVTLRSADGTAANLAALDMSATDQADLQSFIAQRFGQQAG
jgi:hypothetical protein